MTSLKLDLTMDQSTDREWQIENKLLSELDMAVFV